jgi:hypothetical protein
MSLKKNISGGPLDVPLLSRIVEADETVEVPDFQPAHNPDAEPGDPDYLAIVWPPDKWQDAAPAKPAAKAKADDTSGKADA